MHSYRNPDRVEGPPKTPKASRPCQAPELKVFLVDFLFLTLGDLWPRPVSIGRGETASPVESHPLHMLHFLNRPRSFIWLRKFRSSTPRFGLCQAPGPMLRIGAAPTSFSRGPELTSNRRQADRSPYRLIITTRLAIPPELPFRIWLYTICEDGRVLLRWLAQTVVPRGAF